MLPLGIGLGYSFVGSNSSILTDEISMIISMVKVCLCEVSILFAATVAMLIRELISGDEAL